MNMIGTTDGLSLRRTSASRRRTGQSFERIALSQKLDVEKLRWFGEIQQAADERKARASFAAALVRMQPNLPVVAEHGEIKDRKGDVQHTYALWEDINEAIRPVLAKYGFALTFKTGLDGRQVTVTGELRHRAGHREETTMTLPMDLTGSKNGVQAIGSSTSYGKRYTAMALLNLTSRGEDDDGSAADRGATIDDEQQELVRSRAMECGANLKKLLSYLKVTAIEDIPASRFNDSLRLIEERGLANDRGSQMQTRFARMGAGQIGFGDGLRVRLDHGDRTGRWGE